MTWEIRPQNIFGLTKVGILSRLGLGTTNPQARLEAVESQQSEIVRLVSGGGWGFGYLSFFDDASLRTRVGFAGGANNIFSNGIANGTFLRADGGPVMLGVGTSLALIIREQGYGPGTGYVGIGGVNDPLSTMEIGGENAPRLGINPQPGAAGRKHWEIVSLAQDYGALNGSLEFYNRTNSVAAFDVSPSGDVQGGKVSGDVAAPTWTLRGRSASAASTGTNQRGGALRLRGGASQGAAEWPYQVAIGANDSETTVTWKGDRAAATLQAERSTVTASHGVFALNLVGRGDNDGDVFVQTTKFDGVWTSYAGWKYEDRMLSVSNASRAPAGQQFAQASQADPSTLVNLLTMAISAGSDVRFEIGLIVLQTGVGSPEGVVVAPTGSMYVNRSGGAGTTFYVKESGAGNTGWIGK